MATGLVSRESFGGEVGAAAAAVTGVGERQRRPEKGQASSGRCCRGQKGSAPEPEGPRDSAAGFVVSGAGRVGAGRGGAGSRGDPSGRAAGGGGRSPRPLLRGCELTPGSRSRRTPPRRRLDELTRGLSLSGAGARRSVVGEALRPEALGSTAELRWRRGGSGRAGWGLRGPPHKNGRASSFHLDASTPPGWAGSRGWALGAGWRGMLREAPPACALPPGALRWDRGEGALLGGAAGPRAHCYAV